MNFKQILDYYSREDVQNALLTLAKNREVVGVFRSGNFSSRPSTLVYPQDIVSMVRTGVMEFHCSLERWSNPMALKSENYESLRQGFDIILDLDCKVFEHGKIAAKIFCSALKRHGINNFSLKFTGGKGFHIGIPWESMPKEVDYRKTVKQFPELARTIGLYLKNFVKKDLEKAFLKKWSIEELVELTGVPINKIMMDTKDEIGINPFAIVDVDPILISPRHLFRMPYSLHKGNLLVSLPLNPEKLDIFEKEHAKPEKIKTDLKFLDKGERREAETLIAEALDWNMLKQIEKRREWAKKVRITKAMPLELAPPCIQNILKGLSDGKKRSVFILINYLSSLKWSWSDIQTTLEKWNQKNTPQLRDSYIRSQVRWHKNRFRNRGSILPPNCWHEGSYDDFGVCKPDINCGGEKKTIKNPVNYPFRKMRTRKKGK